MTRHEAEKLVFELLETQLEYERAERGDKKYHREDYLKLRERVIAALTVG